MHQKFQIKSGYKKGFFTFWHMKYIFRLSTYALVRFSFNLASVHLMYTKYLNNMIFQLAHYIGSTFQIAPKFLWHF